MIKKKLQGDDLKSRLLAGAKDRLFHFSMAAGAVRGAVVNGTRMVNEMRANHEFGVLETLVLGRAYLGVGLMSAGLKGEDRLGVQVECAGPIKGLSVEANAFGEVRGYLKNTPIPVEKPLESFDLSPFFGAGLLSVTRYLKEAKHPFTGRVNLQYGNIAQDLAYYWYFSEQIPSAFQLSIQFDRSGEVVGAGGLFLQTMPDAGAALAKELEKLVYGFPSLGEAFSRDRRAEELIGEEFRAYGPHILANRRIEFMCHCSKEQVHNILMLLPLEDLEDMAAKGPFPFETRCHNCNSAYEFNQDEIRRICGMRFPDN